MKKPKSLLRRILVFTLSLVVLTGIVMQTVDAVYYSPFRQYDESALAFNAIVQLLTPSVTFAFIAEYDHGTPKQLSHYTQRFVLERFSYAGAETKNEGCLEYRFSKAKLIEYTNRLQLDSVPLSQRIFMEPKQTVSDSIWQTVPLDESRFFEVWFAFKSPISTAQLFEDYAPLLRNELSRPENRGVFWIPIQTSDDPDDICVGMAGNFSWFYMGNPRGYPAIQQLFDADNIAHEERFRQCLKYLVDHEQDSEIFLDSGFFGENLCLDISQKLSFVEQNGMSCLGFVAYMNGKSLDDYRNNSDLLIVKIREDIPIEID